MGWIASALRVLRLLETVADHIRGYDRSTPRPHFMVVEATHRCNARCTYCDSWRTPASERAREMSRDEHVRLLRDARRLGVRMVSYTGGEPLLRPDLVEIARAAKALRMRTLVNTNGYLVTEKNAGEILSAFDAVTVSIDSLEPALQAERRGQGKSLELAIRGLDLLLERRCRPGQVRVNVVLDEGNAAGLDELAAHLRERGVPMLLQPLHRATLFPEMVPVGDVRRIDSREHALGDLERFAGAAGGLSRGEGRYIRPFYRGMAAHLKGAPPWFRCYAGSFSFQVSAYGDVMLCQTLRRSLGNVRERPLREIWSAMSPIRSEVSSDGRKCSCWLLCTTLNYLHADRAERVLRRSGAAKLLGWLRAARANSRDSEASGASS
jgi:MoaA/NifB/PqqE/SkfB family radical SAM enzyme